MNFTLKRINQICSVLILTLSEKDMKLEYLTSIGKKTDNPKEFRCPRIHLIFSEDLQEISGYTMQVSLDYQLDDYWTLEKQIADSDIDLIGNIINKLSEIKKEFQKYRKSKVGIPV